LGAASATQHVRMGSICGRDENASNASQPPQKATREGESKPQKLAGKVAIVTGGSTGIGLGMAMELAKEGAMVVIVGRTQKTLDDASKQLKSKGFPHAAFAADVSKEDAVKAMVGKVLKDHKRIDILVNNAGVEGAAGPTEQQTSDEFDRLISINVRSQFLLSKAVIPHMKERNAAILAKLKKEGKDDWKGLAGARPHAGAIINLSSIAGKKGFASLSLYSATNYARIGFTNSLALELADSNITVNAVCPGIVWTDMWDSLAAKFGGSNEADKKQETFEASINKLIPLKRPQFASEMGDLVVYFATEPNVTGQSVAIDGGYCA